MQLPSEQKKACLQSRHWQWGKSLGLALVLGLVGLSPAFARHKDKCLELDLH
jgi:hypothetical protein